MKIDPVFAKTHPELYAMIDYFDKSQRQRWDDKIEDMTVVDAQPDKVVFELVIHDYHCNQVGTIHGGCVATLIDVGTSFATLVHAGKAKWKAMGVSVDLTVSYLMGVRVGETIRIECTLLRMGKNLANMSAVIYNSAGKVCYTGSHTKFNVDSRL